MNSSPSAETIRVGIIEDQAELRDGLAMLIGDTEGYQCTGLWGSVEDALEGFSGAIPNVLLTDIGLPGMNGGELVREVRRRRPTLKVLFTTGYARDALENRARLDPGIGLLPKPFTRNELAARVREVLDS